MMCYRIFIISIFSLLFFQLSAQKVYEINSQYPVHNLESHLELIKDTDHSFTYTQLLNDTSLIFSLQGQLPKRLEIGAIYWARIVISTPNQLSDWTLNFEDQLIGGPAWIKSNGF